MLRVYYPVLACLHALSIVPMQIEGTATCLEWHEDSKHVLLGLRSATVLEVPWPDTMYLDTQHTYEVRE